MPALNQSATLPGICSAINALTVRGSTGPPAGYTAADKEPELAGAVAIIRFLPLRSACWRGYSSMISREAAPSHDLFTKDVGTLTSLGYTGVFGSNGAESQGRFRVDVPNPERPPPLGGRPVGAVPSRVPCAQPYAQLARKRCSIITYVDDRKGDTVVSHCRETCRPPAMPSTPP
jgi:hypothetical protein